MLHSLLSRFHSSALHQTQAKNNNLLLRFPGSTCLGHALPRAACCSTKAAQSVYRDEDFRKKPPYIHRESNAGPPYGGGWEGVPTSLCSRPMGDFSLPGWPGSRMLETYKGGLLQGSLDKGSGAIQRVVQAPSPTSLTCHTVQARLVTKNLLPDFPYKGLARGVRIPAGASFFRPKTSACCSGPRMLRFEGF